MMRKRSAPEVRQIATVGLLTALTAVMTVFTKIPTPLPQGYFNLGDTVVLTGSILFGSLTGSISGALGAAFADILTGGFMFAPITFIVKGLEGYVAGAFMGGGIVNRAAEKSPAAENRKLPGGGIKGQQLPGGGAKGQKLPRGNIDGQKLPYGNIGAALCLGSVIMVAGYFLAESTVLSLFSAEFGIAAALSELPFNLIQGGLSIILARIIIEGLKRARVF